jgi:hypothetical protein
MMQTDQIVHCPNCGSLAERHYFTSSDPTYAKCLHHQVTQTECPVCDYLMVMCSLTGNVIESYASSQSVQSISRINEIELIQMRKINCEQIKSSPK